MVNSTSQLLISVIIPVLNDVDRLRTCLQALHQQTFPEDRYEIIVVDNGPSDDVAACVAQFPNVRYLVETIPTQFAARNTAIKAAKGEILAFTDADCLPGRQWLAKGVEKITQTPNCGLVGGHIEVFPANPDDPSPVELFEVITALPQEELIQRWGFGATANIFTYRHIFETVGLFDTALASGGDLEWGKRVSRAGYAVVYAPEAIIRHPARDSWKALRARTIRVIGGVHNITQKSYPNQTPIRRFLSLFQDLWRDWPNLSDLTAIYQDDRLPSAASRLQVLLVTLRVKVVRFSERIRLYLGASTRTDYIRPPQS